MPEDVIFVDCASQGETPCLFLSLLVLRFFKMSAVLLLYSSRALPLTANDRKMNSPVEMKRVKCLKMTCNKCNLMLDNLNRNEF